MYYQTVYDILLYKFWSFSFQEQEARTKLLRDRVKNDFSESSSIESSVSSSLVLYNEPRHINLFIEHETSSGVSSMPQKGSETTFLLHF